MSYLEVSATGVLRERHDDSTRTVTLYDAQGQVTLTRDYTVEENAAADAAQEAEARLVSIEDRLAALEAHAFPPAPDPTDTAGVPTWGNYGGIAPAGALLLDGGKVWRNVSGVPLAHPPSGFPGWTEAHLAHLWAVVVDAQPDPEPVEPDPEPVDPSTIYVPWKGEWDKDTTFAVGDYTIRDGVIYRAKVAHGAAYQGTWGPPSASVWDIVGDV